jgi:hypothetical protein
VIDRYIGAEQPGKAWPHLFFIAFLKSMAEGLGPGQTADFRKKFEMFRDKAWKDYRDKKVGARSLAPILMLMQYGLAVMDAGVEARLERHVLIEITKTIQTEVMADDEGLTDRACLGALQGTAYKPLMPAWKSLIEFCFFAYREPLKVLVSATFSNGAWEAAIRDILPFLWPSKIIPIHEIKHADHLIIDEPEKYGQTPATYTNIVRTPLPLYARLFTEEELRSHVEEQKIIDDTFAHLNATLGMIGLLGDGYFESIKADVFRIAKGQGKLAARQKVLLLKSHSLSIPAYFADELIDALKK